MNKRRWALLSLLVFASFAFFPSRAQSVFYTRGKELVKYMQAYERVTNNDALNDGDYVNAALYMGYVGGVCDVIAAHKDSYRPSAFDFERLIRASRNQIFAVVAKYLENNPERWDNLAVQLIYEAIMKAFPGKQSNK